MSGSTVPWRTTTHEWSRAVDGDHLASIRQHPARYSPGGVLHLILEVLAYAADEAQHHRAARCRVTLHADGSIAVSDDGRGTDTRIDDHARLVRKPVMATRDLRFFDVSDAPLLPDSHPRRGMSVVAALSQCLVHTNRRRDGAWTQRYEHGIPVTALVPIPDDDTTGTTVRFRPGEGLSTLTATSIHDLGRSARSWSHLIVEINDQRAE